MRRFLAVAVALCGFVSMDVSALAGDGSVAQVEAVDHGSACAASCFRFDPEQTMERSLALGAANDESAWRVEFDAWLWTMGMDGTVGVKGLEIDVNSSFTDVLEASDSLIGLMGRIEIGIGKWSVFVDGIYARIGVEDIAGPLAGIIQLDVVNRLSLVDFGLMYRVWEGEATVERATGPVGMSLDAYVGGRYTDVGIEIMPENPAGPKVDGSKDWIDPIVGARLIAPLGEHFELRVWGDVGGFGVSSDFTWSATALLGYDFTLFGLDATVFGGYRAIGQDYTDGTGINKFTWDVVLHGPQLGLAIRF